MKAFLKFFFTMIAQVKPIFFVVVFIFYPLLSWSGPTQEDLSNLQPIHLESSNFTSTNGPDKKIVSELKVNSKYLLKLQFQMDKNFHAYEEQFRLKLIGPQSFFLSEPQITPTVKFIDPITKKTRVGTENYFEISSYLEVSSQTNMGTHNIELAFTYQACGKEFCLLPRTVPLVIPVVIGTSDSTEVATTSDLESALNKSWLSALLIVFIAGILTSLTPCIFPMIPITLAIIGSRQSHGSRWKGFSTSLVYVLGIAFTYSLLGIFAAKSGAIFGSYLGHPFVVTGIAFIFIIMGLSMFGAFEIQAPQFLTNRLNNLKTGQNYLGAFISGLVAGVVASPCVGPVLISILTYVTKTQNMLHGFVLLFTFALGVGQLFILLGTFQGLLHRLPKSGAWMDRVKKIFGVVMFAMAIYYVYPLFKKPIDNYLTKIGVIKSESVSHNSPPWQPYSEDLLNNAIRERKPVVIDFNAEWCGACKELEKYTFSDTQVIEYGKNFVWLNFDATEPSEELDKLQDFYKIGGLPFIVFYGTNGKPAKHYYLTGFENAQAFLERLKKVKELE